MKKKTNKEEKVCWSCKRIIVEESKLGLCPNCVNKYGTPIATACALGIAILAKQAYKHSGKALKVVDNAIKNINKV